MPLCINLKMFLFLNYDIIITIITKKVTGIIPFLIKKKVCFLLYLFKNQSNSLTLLIFNLELFKVLVLLTIQIPKSTNTTPINVDTFKLSCKNK